jgi:hypothetical protein
MKQMVEDDTGETWGTLPDTMWAEMTDSSSDSDPDPTLVVVDLMAGSYM